MKGEITVKNYRRNRTETLSLRLTAEEKQVLKALAEKRNLSMTDYILLSALHYSAGEHYRHALKTLEQIRTELLALQKSNPGDAVCDALEKQILGVLVYGIGTHEGICGFGVFQKVSADGNGVLHT